MNIKAVLPVGLLFIPIILIIFSGNEKYDGLSQILIGLWISYGATRLVIHHYTEKWKTIGWSFLSTICVYMIIGCIFLFGFGAGSLLLTIGSSVGVLITALYFWITEPQKVTPSLN